MPIMSYRSTSPIVFEDLEQQLFFSLRPVQPSQEFVSHLQHRLTSPPTMTVEREYTILSMMLVAISLFSGLMLVWLLRRFRSA